MKLSKLLMVSIISMPFIIGSVTEKRQDKIKNKKELNEILHARKKTIKKENTTTPIFNVDSTYTNKEIKQKQEKYFEKIFNTHLGKVNYLRKDLPVRYEMIIKGEDSIHIDKEVDLWKRRNVLLHEYAHLKQKEMMKKLKKIGIYNSDYDNTSDNIYSILITEGSAEAAQYLALKKEPPKKYNFVALCRERDAGMNQLRKAEEFYNTGANFIYPLMKKLGLEETIIGLYTTKPPKSLDFWNKERRKNYLKKVEKNSKKYSPIVLIDK